MSNWTGALTAPFTWFGGKSRVSPEVWEGLGDVDHYIEPFFGSGAVLFGRPSWHKNTVETVNDIDQYLCVAPETNILRSDLTWSKAGDLNIDDDVLAFDENNGGAREGLRAPAKYRHWQHAKVTRNERVVLPCYRLKFDDGTEVITSENHLWLSGSHRSGGRGWRWIQTKNLICNRKRQRSWVLKLASVIQRENTWDSGWVGGFFDGEGHIVSGAGWGVSVSQNQGISLDRAKNWLENHNFKVFENAKNRCVVLYIRGGMRETLRFLMMTRPERLIENMKEKIENASIYGRDHQAVSLIEKEFLGDREVVALATTSKTFVAEGLASHNCNFWRAAIHNAEAVTRYADYPINEADLFARHLWLQDIGKQQLQDGLVSDPDWYDAKIAGWWLWGINQWLGTGWCAGTGAWRIVDGKLTRVKTGGAPRQLIHISNPGIGLNGQQKRHWSYEYMQAIANRMRYVRVACGDWRRVLTDGAMYSGRVVGVFLDPPYSDTNRRDKVYTHDSTDIAHEVRRWAIDHGDDPRLRIVLAGYEGEHDMPETWRKVAWTANLTYSSGNGEGQNEKNRTLERLWFSPHCLRPAPTLFDFDL